MREYGASTLFRGQSNRIGAGPPLGPAAAAFMAVVTEPLFITAVAEACRALTNSPRSIAPCARSFPQSHNTTEYNYLAW